MASKIKIKVENDKDKINLPAIPIGFFIFLLNLSILFFPFIPKEYNYLDKKELKTLKSILKELKVELKKVEKFDFIRVQTSTQLVKISLL